LKGQRGKMGVKSPKKNERMMMEDVSHRKTMPLAASKKCYSSMNLLNVNFMESCV